MTESPVVVKAPARKVRLNTRRYLRLHAEVQAAELKYLKASYQRRKPQSWRDQKREAAFAGCDPLRTLALIGQEA